jgi:seryl-tRNA synthetase
MGCSTKAILEIKDHVERKLKRFEVAFAHRFAFAVMREQWRGMNRALIQFMLNTHYHGYQRNLCSYMVNKVLYLVLVLLPKFENDLFKTNDERNCLIPTAEVPVTNILRDELLNDDVVLPIKLVCHTPCFRSRRVVMGVIRAE